jgi:2-polyprenyl-6-methoxyphenol hydroxylase-like FAD-dependent oxidoreductase
MVCISNALIIGGGIAGLSAAITLSKAGVQCDVLEIADAPLGSSIGISGRAADALAELGVYDECYATSSVWDERSSAGTFWDAAGNMISRVPDRPSWPGAKTALGIYRPIMLELFEQKAKSLGSRIHRGVKAIKIEPSKSGPSVTLSDGQVNRYDLVIGADGIWSSTRREVFPDAPTPEYAGQMSIRWMAPGPAVADEGFYMGSAGRVGFYYMPQDLVYVPAVIASPHPIRPTADELFTLFDNLLASFTAPAIVELRRRLTREANLICRPFEWVLVSEPWRDGVLLIGDAAHATTAHMGMGGGMAIEDSVVLGQCIAGAGSLDEAVTQFMARRFNRVRTVVETSVAISKGEQTGAPLSERMRLTKDAFAVLAEAY